MTRLDGQTAVVTGAVGGLGRAIARAFATAGANVVAFDITEDPGPAFVTDLREAGSPSAWYQHVDVRSGAEVDRAFAVAAERAGTVDVLVNCAGIREISPFLELEADEWAWVLAVNLTGTFYCSQAAARLMVESGRGAIVNIASTGGLVGSANRAAYCASKHGVLGLTKGMATDLGRFGIRVNAVCPGLIRTPLTEEYFADADYVEHLASIIPLGDAGEVQFVANTVLFLATPMSAYITGVGLPVDGGFLASSNQQLVHPTVGLSR